MVYIVCIMIGNLSELDEFFMSYMPAKGSTGALRENRLWRMESLLRHLGSPEKSLDMYHLAGSKGKGTTATIVARLLEASGKKTGLYMSPHVYDLRERFTLAGRFFTAEEYLRTAEELRSRLENFPQDIRPTTFELYTAYAYMLFRDTGCTHAVIETGMGGRLDATNTIDPRAVVLLPIELEHTNVLGDTIEKIATEKSKIMRAHRPAFIARNTDEAKQVFVAEALSLECPIHMFDDEIKDFVHKESRSGNELSFRIDDERFTLHPALCSKAAAENIALGILLAKREGFLTDEGISEVEKLDIPGRFERRRFGSKTAVFEVAHTKNSVENAVRTFFGLYGDERTACVFGSVDGKDYESMLDIILAGFRDIAITRAGDFKRTDTAKLYGYAAGKCRADQVVTCIHDAKDALDYAFSRADIILVIGSFYLIGQFGEHGA